MANNKKPRKKYHPRRSLLQGRQKKKHAAQATQ
nr:MAG TPA: hypothetical protein [Caudoviricetes sp.]